MNHDTWKPAPGECAYGCGCSVMPGGDLCEDCAAGRDECNIQDAKRERREAARLDRQRHLQELARQGCGCASEAECRIHTFDWDAVPKSKARKLYQEMRAGCMRAQRLDAEATAWQKEKDRLHEERDRQNRARWVAVKVVIKPSPLLISLRRTVLTTRDDRCPKWRFRLAPDLVVQIQPRPGERRDRFHLFECIALKGEDLAKVHFDSRKARAGLTYIEFGIIKDPETDGWRTEPHAFSHGADILMAQLVDLLPKLEVIDPRKMFSNNCLICGKELTDPASMARWIGPECAGTASLNAGLFAPKSPNAGQQIPMAV